MSEENGPTPEAVASYADRHSLSVADTGALAEQFAQQDAVLDALDALVPDDPPDRESWDPDPDRDDLGAWLTRCDVVRDDADGPLNRLTVGVKDNIAVAGVPMTCGSPLLADPDYVPARDAVVVDRLLDAGPESSARRTWTSSPSAAAATVCGSGSPGTLMTGSVSPGAPLRAAVSSPPRARWTSRSALILAAQFASLPRGPVSPGSNPPAGW